MASQLPSPPPSQEDGQDGRFQPPISTTPGHPPTDFKPLLPNPLPFSQQHHPSSIAAISPLLPSFLASKPARTHPHPFNTNSPGTPSSLSLSRPAERSSKSAPPPSPSAPATLSGPTTPNPSTTTTTNSSTNSSPSGPRPSSTPAFNAAFYSVHSAALPSAHLGTRLTPRSDSTKATTPTPLSPHIPMQNPNRPPKKSLAIQLSTLE